MSGSVLNVTVTGLPQATQSLTPGQRAAIGRTVLFMTGHVAPAIETNKSLLQDSAGRQAKKLAKDNGDYTGPDPRSAGRPVSASVQARLRARLDEARGRAAKATADAQKATKAAASAASGAKGSPAKLATPTVPMPAAQGRGRRDDCATKLLAAQRSANAACNARRGVTGELTDGPFPTFPGDTPSPTFPGDTPSPNVPCEEARERLAEVQRACASTAAVTPEAASTGSTTATTTLQSTSPSSTTTSTPGSTPSTTASTQSTARVTQELTCQEEAQAAMDHAFEACVSLDPTCEGLLSEARAQAGECLDPVTETPTASPKPSVNDARILGPVLGAIFGVVGVAGGLAYFQNRNSGEPGQPVAVANAAPGEVPPAYTPQDPPPAYTDPAPANGAQANAAPAVEVEPDHVIVNIGDAVPANAALATGHHVVVHVAEASF